MNITRACTVLLMLTLFSAFEVRAQQISITGKIQDEEGQQPIHGANVSIDKKGVGTATNRSGDYILLIPAANLKDTLRVSCIGYQTRFFPISGLKDGQVFNIVLQKNNVQLKEVNVEYHDPLKIIEKAKANIAKNYINHPHTTRGFYRMYTAKGNDPLELSEAVFDIYNFGYADKRADIFKLTKARDEKNQRDFHSLELGQKPNNIFNYDVVNHLANSGFLSEAGIKKHKFEYAGMVDVKGYPAYEVDFKEINGAKDGSFRGKFFVDTRSYAFIYFDFGLSPSGLKDDESGNFVRRILMGQEDVEVGIKSDRQRVSYQKVGDKWVLSDMVGDDALLVKSTKYNYNYVADVKFNYQVTAVDTTQVESFDNKFGRHESINDHDSNDGEEFWKDYNILLADYKTEDVFKQIQAINGQTKLKDKFEEKLKKLPKDSIQRLDALLNFYHDNGQFNGTALIKSKGKIIFSKSYGYADRETKTQANSHSTYGIGTTAFTFTSVLINQLAAEGRIDVHAALKTYMPWYKNGDVTVEQLLTNRSGIPDYSLNPEYKTQILTKPFALKDMVVNFCSDSLNFTGDNTFEYSRSNFVVLALLAQEVSGKPFGILLQERIFTPAQMTDTYFGAYKGTANHQAKPYNESKVTPETIFDPANEAGAGGISSSADDMLKYSDALLANKLLPAAQKAEMLKPRVEYKDDDAFYDYGWMTDRNAFDVSKIHAVTYHPGNDLGYYTIFARQEDADNCIILLNNTADFPKNDMTDLILNILN